MTETQPLGGFSWFLLFLFAASGTYGLLGHLILYVRIQGKVKTTRFLANVPFYAVARYFAQDPADRTRAMDIFAITVALSVPILLVSVILLQPRISS